MVYAELEKQIAKMSDAPRLESCSGPCFNTIGESPQTLRTLMWSWHSALCKGLWIATERNGRRPLSAAGRTAKRVGVLPNQKPRKPSEFLRNPENLYLYLFLYLSLYLYLSVNLNLWMPTRPSKKRRSGQQRKNRQVQDHRKSNGRRT